MVRVVTFGEIMLRLKPVGFERFLQSPFFEATFGGGEANVAVGLGKLGVSVRYVTCLPPNPIGDACIAELNKHGVDTSFIVRRGERIGIYYLEAGANQRPSRVIYDRANSSIATAKPGDINWDDVFKDATWFHLTGITPAISESAAELSAEALKKAKQHELAVSIDLNYRKKLWRWGKSASEVMRELLVYADYAIGNEEDCQQSLGIKVEVDVDSGELDIKQYEKLTEMVMKEYRNLRGVGITLRESISASHNRWSAVLRTREKFYVSKKHDITHIVDRVGSGDAFACGLIYGLNYLNDEREALEFAVAESCLKHTIPGDFPLITFDEVNALMKGGGSGRVQR